MFKLLPRGAYPRAGLQLIEALRDYERMLEQRPAREDRHYYHRRGRSEFSWHQVLSEFCYDPLRSPCLQRQNWAKIRPQLYVSTYVTERDNFVIEVRPCIDSGFRYAGRTFIEENGDFRHFPIAAGGWDRPTNRVLYICLGEVASSFRANEPWVTHMYPGAQHASERQLLVLAVQAKLHQLSLYFDCHVDRELVMFGPEHYIDFRMSRSARDATHQGPGEDAISNMVRLDPDRWAPPAIKERLANAGLDVAELYKFAVEYLATLDEKDQLQAYSEYLAVPRARPATQADVDELLRYAADKGLRAASLLTELAVDTKFTERFKEHRLFDYFCRHFSFTVPEGLAWLGRHHPDALAHTGHIGTAALIAYLRTLEGATDALALSHLDKLLADRLGADNNFKWKAVNSLPGLLDAEAREYGFPSFEALQLWAKDQAPRTWAAGAARAARLAQYIAACEADALAKRQASSLKRKATLAARKAATAAEKTA